MTHVPSQHGPLLLELDGLRAVAALLVVTHHYITAGVGGWLAAHDYIRDAARELSWRTTLPALRGRYGHHRQSHT